MKVALVEIGSRALRLLVATRDKCGIRILKADAEPCQLNASGSPAQELRHRVSKLLAEAADYDAAVVFGTEALRVLSKQDFSEVHGAIPELVVLSSEEEASACHASACLVAYMTGRQHKVVFSGDIGGGSFELCAGRLDTPGALISHIGTQLGSDRLRALYDKAGIGEVRRAAYAAFSAYTLHRDVVTDACLFFSGSPATKLAWLIHRSMIGDEHGLPYEMKKVQGRMVSKTDLEKSLAHLEQCRSRNRDLAARLVSPENPASTELESLIAGMQVMLNTMQFTAQARFFVNAYGVRHGLAWLILQPPSLDGRMGA